MNTYLKNRPFLILCRKKPYTRGGVIIMDILEKTDGRLEPAAEREYAHKEGKPFKCEKCGVIQRIKGAEFAGDYRCAVCGGKLHD